MHAVPPRPQTRLAAASQAAAVSGGFVMTMKFITWLGAGVVLCAAQQSDGGGMRGKIIGLGTGYVRTPAGF